MNNREQFEVWYLESWGHTEDNHESLFERCHDVDEYYRLGVRMAYEAWQAASKASEQQLAAVVAENAGPKDFVKTCFHAAADGASLDGADIQELGERLGLFGRETYQPALHGYICGHEAGEDTVYVMKKTPATDAFLAEVRAQGVDALNIQFKKCSGMLYADSVIETAAEFAAKLRQGAAL